MCGVAGKLNIESDVQPGFLLEQFAWICEQTEGPVRMSLLAVPSERTLHRNPTRGKRDENQEHSSFSAGIS